MDDTYQGLIAVYRGGDSVNPCIGVDVLVYSTGKKQDFEGVVSRGADAKGRPVLHSRWIREPRSWEQASDISFNFVGTAEESERFRELYAESEARLAELGVWPHSEAVERRSR